MPGESRTRLRSGAPNEARFGFSQAVEADGAVWIAGQVAKDNATGEMLQGTGSLGAQVGPALENVVAALEALGADARGLVRLDIHLVGSIDAARAPLAAALARFGCSPVVAVARVPALSHSDYLVEVSALAERIGGLAEMIAPGSARTPPGLDSPAVVERGGRLYASGCYGSGPDRGAALGEALEGLGGALTARGSRLAEVVSEHVYVVGPVDATGFERICDAHRSAFRGAEPASTLVVVDELGPPQASVLVSAVAVRAERPSVDRQEIPIDRR